MDTTKKMREDAKERHQAALYGRMDEDGTLSLPSDCVEYWRIYGYAYKHGMTLDGYLGTLGVQRAGRTAEERHISRLMEHIDRDGAIPPDLRYRDKALYGTLCSYAKQHGMTYLEYVEYLGFTQKRKRAPGKRRLTNCRPDVDRDAADVLVGAYHVPKAEIASWLNVTRQRMGQILLAECKKEHASWLVDHFAPEEEEILSGMKERGEKKLEKDGVRYRVFVSDGHGTAMAVIRAGDIRVFLPDDAKKTADEAEEPADPLSGKTVMAGGEMYFKPDHPEAFLREAARRVVTAGELSEEISGLPLMKRGMKTDEDVKNALSAIAEDGVLTRGTGKDTAWLFGVAAHRGMTIREFAASYGFKYLSPEERTKMRHKEMFAAHTDGDGLTYIPYGREYCLLSSEADRCGMTIMEYGESLGFTMLDRDGDTRRRHRNDLAVYEKAHGSLDGLNANGRKLYGRLSTYAHNRGMSVPEYIRSLGFKYREEEDNVQERGQ